MFDAEQLWVSGGRLCDIVTDRAGLNIGTTVRIEVDGVEGSYSGTVRWIKSEPAFTPYYALNKEQRSRLVYMAEVGLPPRASDLPVGLPVTAYLP